MSTERTINRSRIRERGWTATDIDTRLDAPSRSVQHNQLGALAEAEQRAAQAG